MSPERTYTTFLLHRSYWYLTSHLATSTIPLDYQSLHYVSSDDTGIIVSDIVFLRHSTNIIAENDLTSHTFLNTVKAVHKFKSHPEADRNAFQKAKEEEIHFLMHEKVI